TLRRRAHPAHAGGDDARRRARRRPPQRRGGPARQVRAPRAGAARARVSRAVATALLREQAADPWRCWIRHAPARWPGPDRPWIDVAAGRLGNSDGEPEMLTALLGQRLDDVLYLPPVGP